MKRSSVLFLAAVVATVGIASGAAAGPQSKTWKETRDYVLPGGIGADTDLPGVLIGSVEFDPGAATSVRITVEDAAAPATLAEVSQGHEALGTFCTSSTKPIRIAPNTPMHVDLFAGTCDGSPSFVTTGSVSATFSKR
ncbi:MAG: hypothetical protein QOK47_1398 [Actinomycetota bacterium]|nr:hypothetical protein [Actinomycetota bacterium]